LDFEHPDQTQDQAGHGGDVGYEPRDVNVVRIAVISVVAVIVVAVTLLTLKEFFMFESEQQIQQAVLAPPSITLTELRVREDNELTSYALIDTTAGTYRIPIERAMELLTDEAFQKRTESKSK